MCIAHKPVELQPICTETLMSVCHFITKAALSYRCQSSSTEIFNHSSNSAHKGWKSIKWYSRKKKYTNIFSLSNNCFHSTIYPFSSALSRVESWRQQFTVYY